MPGTQVTLYRIDDIEIDISQRCVRRSGRVDTPRARVFDLLLYLIENRSRPVSRKELMDRIWDGAVISDSVLYKTILEARRVLGDEGDDPHFVKTLPKVGYQFVANVKVETRLIGAGAVEHPAYSFPRNWFWIGVAAALLLGLGAAAWWRSARFGLPDLPDDEFAWWRFSEGSGAVLKDSVGKANGRLVGASAGGPPPHWVRGRRGGALSVSGGNFVEGDIRFPEPSALTLSAWLRLDESHPYEGAVFDSPRLSLFLPPVGVEFGRPHGVGAAVSLGGKWHHIVGVDEGPITKVGRIFVDGVERASSLLPDSGPSVHSRWRLGQTLLGGAPYRGLIDDFRIYARPLRKMEIEAIYRCGKEQPDFVDSTAKPYYFLPIFAGGIELAPDGSFANGNRDFGGMQLAEQSGPCNMDSLRGADLGQNLRIALDLRVVADAEGHTAEGGPYIRSRRAYPGDGIAGGSSSGYWIKLHPDGRVRLWQLRPYNIVAASSASTAFDASGFHRLEVVVQKSSVHVFLDGAPVDFEKDGRIVQTVDIQETGPGRGTAGIAFSAESNRSMLGGQQVRNLSLTVLPR